ncbi:MAG: hypothetical protein CMF50_06320 [Legionellales bacterium]|nr:hypothetical protein [Legionellales bacterium]|tara:strand:+ start:18604 stop:19119 length:516 start_codon:yes stop_codon:yes gene_type:complete
MDKPEKTLKPKLIPWVLLAYYFPLQLNISIFVGGACAGISFVLFTLSWGWTDASWQWFVFFPLLFFITVPAFIYFVRSQTYQQTEYKFYRDRLEYAEGFWTIEKKSIKYAHITEVYMRRNVIQRFYNMGTIYLSVPAISARGGFIGVAIVDVQNPDAAYDDVQAILSRYQA